MMPHTVIDLHGEAEGEAEGDDVGKSILFVCAANVCRSPLMQFEFTNLLAADGTAEQWHVSSAGAQVAGSHRVCSVVSAMLTREGVDQRELATHRSRPLTPDIIEAADLIVTASLSERAAVARLVPRARDRAFTLREAIVLSAADLVAVDDLREVSLQLNKRRAFGLLPTVPRSARAFTRTHPLDVPDDHSSRAGKHAGTLASARTLVRTLHTQLTGVVAAR